MIHGLTPEKARRLVEWINAEEAKDASADTHPKDGDVKQAPLVSGAVAKPDAQEKSA